MVAILVRWADTLCLMLFVGGASSGEVLIEVTIGPIPVGESKQALDLANSSPYN